MQLPDGVRVGDHKGFPCLDVQTDKCRARVMIQGAHVIEFSSGDHEPLLFESAGAEYRAGKALRGGIPICWPWFGPLAPAEGMPAHGFARTVDWEFGGAEALEDGDIVLRFSLDTGQRPELWAHASTLAYEVRLGAALGATLTTTNTSEAPWNFTAALHTYLHVGDIGRVRVEGLEGAFWLDQRDVTKGWRKDEDSLRIDGEIDRIYRGRTTVQVVDESLGRVLLVENGGTSFAVLWNPWVKKSAGMSDLPPGQYKKMLCFEAANLEGDIVTLEPGASHSLSTRVSILSS